VFAPASGFVFPPGFVTISGWNDTDGSETITLDIIVVPVLGNTTIEFTLAANGSILTPVASNQWRLTGSNPTGFQALLDSLVLTPQSAQPYNGTIFVDFAGRIVDRAVFAPTGNSPFPLEVITPPQDIGSASVLVRFFVGGSVRVSPIVAAEGSAADLGSGRIVASSPDEQPGDLHVLSLTVPSGLLVVNSSAVPAGLAVDRQVAGDGSTTIRLIGTIATINQFLALPNSVTYTPTESTFSGILPLTIQLVNQPALGSAPIFSGSLSIPSQFPPNANRGSSGFSTLDPASGGVFGLNMPPATPHSLDLAPRRAAPNAVSIASPVKFTPVATAVVPSAVDVVTPQDTPVGVFINLTPPSTDPSETVEILVQGVPPGASFNRGTNLGGGTWSFQPADLDGLIFTPPLGVTGEFPLIVVIIVTDTNPLLELTDISKNSTQFTITVLPVALGDPPLFLPPDLGTPLSGIVVAGASGNARGLPGGLASGGFVASRNTRSEAFLGYTGSSGHSGLPLGQWPRIDSSVPSPETLFAQAEPVVPIYASSEKHPLPPVLPLDQTLPVAGFTDSGGDSFALVDMVYRDAGGPGPVSVAPPPHAPDRTLAVTTAEPGVSAQAAPPGSDPATTGVAAAASIETTPPLSWLVWAGAPILAGSIAVGGWLTGRSGGAVGRVLRRLFSTLVRPTVKRTA
jgi:hypothetical protein